MNNPIALFLVGISKIFALLVLAALVILLWAAGFLLHLLHESVYALHNGAGRLFDWIDTEGWKNHRRRSKRRGSPPWAI